jgi:predicted transcriptional regulator
MTDEPEPERGDAAKQMAERLDAARRRLAEMSASMDETKRRQDEIQRQQSDLLEQLARISRAMDGEAEKQGE